MKPVAIYEFHCGEAYRLMVATEKFKLTKQARLLMFFGNSREETLKRLKEEFPLHSALAGMHERVISEVYAPRGLR